MQRGLSQLRLSSENDQISLGNTGFPYQSLVMVYKSVYKTLVRKSLYLSGNLIVLEAQTEL